MAQETRMRLNFNTIGPDFALLVNADELVRLSATVVKVDSLPNPHDGDSFQTLHADG
jgi:hypothetical protein